MAQVTAYCSIIGQDASKAGTAHLPHVFPNVLGKWAVTTRALNVYASNAIEVIYFSRHAIKTTTYLVLIQSGPSTYLVIMQ